MADLGIGDEKDQKKFKASTTDKIDLDFQGFTKELKNQKPKDSPPAAPSEDEDLQKKKDEYVEKAKIEAPVELSHKEKFDREIQKARQIRSGKKTKPSRVLAEFEADLIAEGELGEREDQQDRDDDEQQDQDEDEAEDEENEDEEGEEDEGEGEEESAEEGAESAEEGAEAAGEAGEAAASGAAEGGAAAVGGGAAAAGAGTAAAAGGAAAVGATAATIAVVVILILAILFFFIFVTIPTVLAVICNSDGWTGRLARWGTWAAAQTGYVGDYCQYFEGLSGVVTFLDKGLPAEPANRVDVSRWDADIRAAAAANNLEYCYVRSFLERESGGDPNAIGHDHTERAPITGTVRRWQSPADGPKADERGGRAHDLFNPAHPPLHNLDWQFSHGIGLMQITIFPRNDDWIDADNPARRMPPGSGPRFTVLQLLNPVTSITAATSYLAHLFQQTGNLETAAARYNGSGSRADAYGRDIMRASQICLRSTT